VGKVVRSAETAFSYGRQVQPLPKLGLWTDALDRLLAANAKGPARERLTLIRIFEELRGLGYAGGYDAVRRYARRWSKAHSSETASAFVPLTFAPGEAYQFDSHGALPVKSFCCSRLRFVGRLFRGECLVLIARAVACEFVCRQSLLAAKVASARRGSRMRSTGEAGMREAHVLDARLVVSPKMLPAANGCRTASVRSSPNSCSLAIHGLSQIA
jgi:hypothetical protein